jgi:hypothetical protein
VVSRGEAFVPGFSSLVAAAAGLMNKGLWLNEIKCLCHAVFLIFRDAVQVLTQSVKALGITWN